MATKKNEELVKILGQRLREIPELDATQTMPAKFKQHLQILRCTESENDSHHLAGPAFDVDEEST